MNSKTKIPRDSKLGNTIAEAVALGLNVALQRLHEQRTKNQRPARRRRAATCEACGATWDTLPGITAGARFDDHTCLDDECFEF